MRSVCALTSSMVEKKRVDAPERLVEEYPEELRPYVKRKPARPAG